MKRTKEKLNWLNLDKLKKSPDFVKHKTINVSKYSLVLQNIVFLEVLQISQRRFYFKVYMATFVKIYSPKGIDLHIFPEFKNNNFSDYPTMTVSSSIIYIYSFIGGTYACS